MQKKANILDWPKPSLEPAIWNPDNTLKPEVKEFILGFIHSFAKANNFKDINAWITDVKFVGSLTTNCWNSNSDMDIHIAVDLSKFVEVEHPEMSEQEASDYLDGIRKQVDQVKAKVPGTEHPTEIYFETEFTTHASQEFSGTYSVLQDKWLLEPHIVGQDFDMSTLHPDLLNLAKETASELDASFGELKRDVQDIKELEETLNYWPPEQRELLEKKLQKRLDELEQDIKVLVELREDVAEKRKHYKALSEQEVRFKYLQKYFYMHVLTDLKTLLKQSPELSVKDIPIVENIMQQASLKLAYQEEENRILVDMDDTICHEASDGECGEPMEGVKEALTKLKEMGYEIVIFSHRADDKHGEDEIKKYLEAHEIPYDSIYKGEKPLARFQIDDRAIHFDNWNSVLKQIEKSASLSTKYWIDPNGKEYQVGTALGHYGWVAKNILKVDDEAVKNDKNLLNQVYNKTEQMMEEGWARISSESGGQFAIEVNKLENLPSYLDNFIAAHFNQAEAENGVGIELDDQQGSFVTITDPFPNIQQAVTKKLNNQMSVAAKILSKKEATAFNPYQDESLKQGPPYAIYIGTQEMGEGYAPVKLYNIFGEHPRFGSTVAEETLQELGIPIRETKTAQLGSEYDFSSTHFLLPKEIAEKIIRWAVETIPEDQIVHDSKDPGTKGVQLESHITLKYGLLTDDFEEVKKALEGEKAPHLKFGKTSFFEPEGKDYDVVIIPVESEDLQKLNEKLCSQVEHDDLQFKEYHPHVTVAYIKKGLGPKYEGKDILEGEELDLNVLTFSPKEGSKQEMELGKATEKSSSFMPSNTDLAPSNDWISETGYPGNSEMDAPQNVSDESTWYSPENDRPRTRNFWQKMLSLFQKPLSKKEPKNIVPVKEASSNVFMLDTDSGLQTKALKDPTSEQAVNLFNSTRGEIHQLRWFIPVDGHLYMWDAYDLTHWDAIKQIGIPATRLAEDINTGVARTEYEAEIIAEEFKEFGFVNMNKQAKQWVTPTEHVNQPGMAWGWADYIYNYVEENWQDLLVGWLNLDPKNYVKPVVLIEKIYQDEGGVSAWVHIEFVNTAANTDAFMKLVISARIEGEQSIEPEGPEYFEHLTDWEIDVKDYGKSDELEKSSSYGPTNYQGPSVADHGYQNSAWDDMNVTYSPEEDEKFLDQNGADGYPNRWMGRHRGPYYTNEGKVVKMLEDTKPQKQTSLENFLPEQEFIPEHLNAGTAIMTDDGSIYWSDEPHMIHVKLIKELGIPVEHIVSGGRIVDGDYHDLGPRSDAMRYVEMELAKQRVEKKRKERRALGKKDIKADFTDKGYWVDPSGKFYSVRESGDGITHSMWAAEHIDALYPDISDNEYNDAYDFLLEHGWVRIGDSSVADYGVEALDPLNLPSYVIDWVNNHVHGKVDIEKYPARRGTRAVIELPVDDLQETINNEFKLQKLAPVAKQAAISGQTVNTILKLIEQNGGATYNLASNKNLVGTDAFAVAIYPDREQIVNLVDYNNLEGYLVENEDLLSDPNNSFGAWVSGGKTYLDVVATIKDKNQAMKLGQEHKQLAIFDLKNLVEIPLQRVAKLAALLRSWIDPQGKVHDISPNPSHKMWVYKNLVDPSTPIPQVEDEVWKKVAEMFESGWTRVSTDSHNIEASLVLEVKDLKRLPPYLDNFVAENFQEGRPIELGDSKGKVVLVYDPFPSLQNAVNKASRQPKVAAAVSDREQQKYYDEIYSDRWRDDSDKIDGGNEYYDWAEGGSNDYPNPKDEEKEHCLLDQLEKPINRNNPVGLGEYAITYYDAFPDQGDKGGI